MGAEDSHEDIALYNGHSSASVEPPSDLFVPTYAPHTSRNMHSLENTPTIALVRAGTLRSIGGTQEGLAAPVWSGKISIETRKDIGPEDVNRFIERELDQVEWVPTSVHGLAFRCGDGRPNEGTEDKIRAGKKLRTVGPQIFGGTPGCALAARAIQGMGTNGEAGHARFTNDVARMNEFLTRRGIEIGGHIDEHTHGDKCGCGAIDEIPRIIAALSNEEAFPTIQNLTKAILGDAFTPEIARDIFYRFEQMGRESDSYLERQGDSFPYRKQTVELLKAHSRNPHQAVQKMVGPHNEVALIVNTVPNTTLNRAKLNVDTNRQYQVFNFDVWACQELAEIYYPKSPKKQLEWLHARVMQTVATAMTLTDGTLPVAVRTRA